MSCAAVLERIGGWKLDVRESTRRALKYRRGAGEIIIVNHDSRGWWDATGSAKGDVFSLVQHLDPSLNFGEVRKVLRGLTGVSPSHPAFREPTAPDTGASPAERWTRRKPIVPADPAWRYLAGARALPAPVLAAAARQDCIRQGAYGSAWFAHRDEGGGLSHIEIRGPDFKGSLRGGRKTLFRFGESTRPLRRLAVLEAAIDALSLAAIEEMRADTLYVATGGGMGPGTVSAIDALLMAVRETGGVLLSGTDANATGDRYAERHAALAAEAGVGFARLRPPEGQDWNDVLRQGRGA
ncbi:MAG: DUF3991 and TOPRIM domain-containing protein [Acetobacteraceae bacterium]|nr:DUF3991 and TOPRIM domain-containing protein [Acetobacteraceae bacterium]